MAYDIPTRFHKVWSRHLRKMCRTNFWRKKERRRRIIRTRYDMIWRIITWLPIPKTMTDINSQEQNSKPTMDINSQHHNLFENQFHPNRRIFVFWRPFWIQNGHHSKPTMDINSQQHHNLLGNQISSQSDNFCILAAILDSKWPP